MLDNRLSRISLMLLAAAWLSGCGGKYVYSTESSGPIFVKVKEPIPEAEPEPIPAPIVTPKIVELSVAQQNEKAISAFSDKGFDAVESDKGVVIYLPPTIYFKGSESSINLQSRTKIAEIAQELAQPYLEKRYIEVSGHTDSLGSASINFELSKQRALAATAELVFSKISKTRLSSVWFGETRLRAPDYNADGSTNITNRNLNRRVEFTILNPQ